VENFNVGDIVIHKMTGGKLMILARDVCSALGDNAAKVVYTVRLPNYGRAKDIQAFEIEGLPRC